MSANWTYAHFCRVCKGYDPTVAEELLAYYDMTAGKTRGGVMGVCGLDRLGLDPHRYLNLCVKLRLSGSLTILRAISEDWDLARIIRELN